MCAIIVGAMKDTTEQDMAETVCLGMEHIRKKMVIGCYSATHPYSLLYGDKEV